MGRLAQYVRDRRIALEMCPSSNVHTGAAKSMAEHPIGLLRRLHFRVTVNTDNRLMSATSMSRELMLVAKQFSYGWADLQWFTVNAMKSAFIGFDERLAIIKTQINPFYAALTGTSPSASSTAMLGSVSSVALSSSVGLASWEDATSSEESSTPELQ